MSGEQNVLAFRLFRNSKVDVSRNRVVTLMKSTPRSFRYATVRFASASSLVDTLGLLLALHVTAASEQDRAQVAELAPQVQAVTGETVQVAFVDQGYTGETAAQAATAQGLRLEVVKLPEPKKGFVLLPKRWVVERSFAWAARFRRLARDYERLPETLAGLHLFAYAILMLKRVMEMVAHSSQQPLDYELE